MEQFETKKQLFDKMLEDLEAAMLVDCNIVYHDEWLENVFKKYYDNLTIKKDEVI